MLIRELSAEDQNLSQVMLTFTWLFEIWNVSHETRWLGREVTLTEDLVHTLARLLLQHTFPTGRKYSTTSMGKVRLRA